MKMPILRAYICPENIVRSMYDFFCVLSHGEGEIWVQRGLLGEKVFLRFWPFYGHFGRWGKNPRKYISRPVFCVLSRAGLF